MEGELEELDKQLRKVKGVPPTDLLIRYLRLVRELHVRDSVTVVRYGNILLRNNQGSMSEEEWWLLHEQVGVAALDCHALPFAASIIRALNRRFPDSIRAQRMQGMYFEATCDYDRAQEMYKDILAKKPTNEMAMKRLVALERSKGNVAGAIEQLRAYLDNFGNDGGAWEEMAELYLEILNYRQAAFCYEELLMINPGSSTTYVRYADILYTIGGASNYKTARAYYAKAVELTAGGSLRALFGILACSAHITDKVVVQDARSRAQIELPDVTAQALLRVYQLHAPSKLPLVTALLQKQGFV